MHAELVATRHQLQNATHHPSSNHSPLLTLQLAPFAALVHQRLHDGAPPLDDDLVVAPVAVRAASQRLQLESHLVDQEVSDGALHHLLHGSTVDDVLRHLAEQHLHLVMHANEVDEEGGGVALSEELQRLRQVHVLLRPVV